MVVKTAPSMRYIYIYICIYISIYIYIYIFICIHHYPLSSSQLCFIGKSLGGIHFLSRYEQSLTHKEPMLPSAGIVFSPGMCFHILFAKGTRMGT